MKHASLVLVAVFLGLTSCRGTNGTTENADLEAASVGSKAYFTEPMICKGLISKKPSGMASGYEQIKMEFISFKSKRKDGKWADSLQIHNAYYKPGEVINDNDDNYGEEWFMGPLSINGKTVSRNSLSGRDDNLVLKIVGSQAAGQKQIDTLEGTYTLKGTVVGGYAYNLKCRATVVKEPSRRDDNTAGKDD